MDYLLKALTHLFLMLAFIFVGCILKQDTEAFVLYVLCTTIVVMFPNKKTVAEHREPKVR